jgi:hypothetical protein
MLLKIQIPNEERGDKGEGWDEFKYDIFDIL